MSYEFNWWVIWDYRWQLAHGLLVTLQIAVASLAFSLALGLAAGVALASANRWVRRLASCYVELFRNVPLIVQMFFFFFGLNLGNFAAAVASLSLYTGAYMANVVYAGITAIPRGQVHAAFSVGLSGAQTWRHIVLPQALAIVIPPLTGHVLNLIKNSAVAMTIAVQELTFAAQNIEEDKFRGFEAATAATLLYLLVALAVVGTIAAGQRLLNLKVRTA